MAETTGRFMKRLYGPGALYEQLYAMMVHINDLRSRKGLEGLDKQFIERIMMAVTEVNGCRYCSYFHARVALNEGIEQHEIEHLLSGDFEYAPREELPALYYAQHYAESGGMPDASALSQLKKTYGEDVSGQIREYIRMIMIGNTWGNAFDALRMRISRKPTEDSTLGRELGVIFGPFWMIPVIALKRLFRVQTPVSETR